MDKVRYWIIQHRYKKHLARLKKQEVVRVGFIVRENSKWSYDALYHKLDKDMHFEPIILIVDERHELCDLEKNKIFFGKYNHRIISNLNDFASHKIDIVFYEQPWFDLEGAFTPTRISKYAVACYVPYGIEIEQEPELIVRTEKFYRSLFMTFCFNEDAVKWLGKYGIHNTYIAGHPRIDAYLDKETPKSPWKTKDKIRIVYAPHHSFGDSPLKQATWEWNGEHILRLAKEHQDTTEWIFKPHPRFKLELAHLLKSKEKAQKVYDDWAEVSQLYDKGSYFDLFKTADLMISDCVSFKLEWLPTGKPYISLHTHYKDAFFFEDIERYTSAYYQADSNEDIDNFFNLLVKDKKDPNKKARLEHAAEIPMGATDKIMAFIQGILK